MLALGKASQSGRRLCLSGRVIHTTVEFQSAFIVLRRFRSPARGIVKTAKLKFGIGLTGTILHLLKETERLLASCEGLLALLGSYERVAETEERLRPEVLL